jgi:hypothetical protein
MAFHIINANGGGQLIPESDSHIEQEDIEESVDALAKYIDAEEYIEGEVKGLIEDILRKAAERCDNFTFEDLYRALSQKEQSNLDIPERNQSVDEVEIQPVLKRLQLAIEIA